MWRLLQNDGDIVGWDILFGIYENPARFKGGCGFDADQEERLGHMLAWRDVHKNG